MAKSDSYYFDYKGQPVAVKLYRERRNDIRFSIGRKTAIMRVPTRLPRQRLDKEYERFKAWVAKQLDLNEQLRQQFFGRIYKNGSQLDIFNRTYTIHITKQDRKTHHAKKTEKDNILIELSEHDESPFIQDVVRKLVSRVVARDCLPEIERKVDYFNDRFFQEEINGIRLKQNQSNWGSCSSNRNLNFSTRLLFAPEKVIDYVIVHELAHLKEMNHSQRFWRWVSNAMPEYKEQEKWLKENGHLCSF